MTITDINGSLHDQEGKYSTKNQTESAGGDHDATMGTPTQNAPLIAGLGDLHDPDMGARMLEAAIDLNSPEKHIRERAQWAVERELSYLSATDSGQHLHNLAKASEDGNYSSQAFFQAIDTAMDDNDVAREVAGISVVEGYTPPGSKSVAGYGPNPSEGDRFTGYRDVAEIAKECRTELKAAQAAGYLPADLEYRVTVDKYTGGQAMTVEVTGLNDTQILAEDWRSMCGGLTEEARELERRVGQIANAWNKQDHDSQSDYFNTTYYCHTTLEQESSKKFRLSEVARRKALRDAKKNA